MATHETHGTGCTFSATLASGLACGRSLPRATAAAQATVAAAIRRAPRRHALAAQLHLDRQTGRGIKLRPATTRDKL